MVRSLWGHPRCILTWPKAEPDSCRLAIPRQGERNSWIEVVLDEGKNRHIRRLLEALEVKVLRLVRVAIGPLRLGKLAKGEYRHLTDEERKALARIMPETP